MPALQPRLIAIGGPNGSGKTILFSLTYLGAWNSSCCPVPLIIHS